jgi:hypothetical protein
MWLFVGAIIAMIAIVVIVLVATFIWDVTHADDETPQ